MRSQPEIYTIGHSNRNLNDFMSLLLKYEIEALVDVRRFPTSKFEHFKAKNLELSLENSGIRYFWIKELGGYRNPILKDSPNIAIKSKGFRNYADYMLTDEFKKAMDELIEIATKYRTAIMCAERLYWRCHRKFISDYLTMKGYHVRHIINDKIVAHNLSRFARIVNDMIIYDKIHQLKI
ncbi:DUF488 domain-containing protein [Archaeoglobales archaeon]|nr:MAG: DUF488 domain-containing protein [Archaeoglobales archaeon]